MKKYLYKIKIKKYLERYFPDSQRFWPEGFGENNEKIRNTIKKHLEEEFIEKKEFKELERILQIAKRRFENNYDPYVHIMTGENLDKQKRRNLSQAYETLYFSRPYYCRYL